MMRRRVLYVPGYDPLPPRRYRELYRREGAAQAAISGYTILQRERRDPTGFGWAAGIGDSHAEFEVLVWSDIVNASMGQSIPATYLQLLQTAWAYIGSGALWRLMRLRRGPVIAALYPIAVLLAQAAVALALGGVLLWLLPWWAGLPLAVLTVWAVLRWWRRLDGRIFAYYLMHDYAFTALQGGAYPQALSARIDDFAQRIGALSPQDWDEVLVVGHSSGAYVAISALARLAREGRLGDHFSLLTLGHVVPMASFLPGAAQLRADLHDLAQADPDWVDITAPGDACCFALCDPVAVSGSKPAGGGGPKVISAAFRQTLSPEKQRSLRGRWFRLHFQYLCAFDRPGDYDYFQITAGPLRLGERFAHRGHSPGRIARPVNRWRHG